MRIMVVGMGVLEDEVIEALTNNALVEDFVIESPPELPEFIMPSLRYVGTGERLQISKKASAKARGRWS